MGFPPLRILVVEDVYLTADFLTDFLTSRGCEVIGPIGRLAPALTLAQQAELDGALLDVNLAGEFSFPIAVQLDERAIPYIFLTGYDENVFPPDLCAVPRVSKPFDPERLIRLIETQFRPSAVR